jgi:hypothetical protein
MLWTYLLLTILFELPIFLLFWHKEGWWQAILFCVLLNGFTNPLINLAIQELGWNVYVLEVAVVATEMLAAMLLLRARFSKALMFSVCANAFSYSLGMLLFWLGWL